MLEAASFEASWPKIRCWEDGARGVAADAGYTPGQTFNTKHPRREAGPQSHGIPPESAGLPATSRESSGIASFAEEEPP
jgi:hypothetical protein